MFSPDGTLISASTAPHCGGMKESVQIHKGPEEFIQAHEGTKELDLYNSQLVSCCFEPSQPQRTTSGLNTKLQSISQLLIPQVIKPQVFFPKPQLKFYAQFRKPKPEKQTRFAAYL